MDISTVTAAKAAHARALECGARARQLAAGQRVGADDVRRAEAALARAVRRAEQARARRQRGPALPLPGRGGPWAVPATHLRPLPPVDVEQLRLDARKLNENELFESYIALGGSPDQWTVDAFVHLGLDLPTSQLQILAHAVWELTTLR